MSLVLVDIDHFKKVNDTWGHEAGDAVLRAGARILQEGVRAVDICVRYGGEEIAMLLAQTDSERAVEVAERLRARGSRRSRSGTGAPISGDGVVRGGDLSGDGEGAREALPGGGQGAVHREARREKLREGKARNAREVTPAS